MLGGLRQTLFSVGIAATLSMGVQSGSAAAQSAAMDPKERAYTLTLVCVVVAANDKDEAGHARALDAARKMAKAQSYSDKRLTDDLFNMTTVLGVEAREKPDSMSENRAFCRRLKLLE